jgi:hypothetical protein
MFESGASRNCSQFQVGSELNVEVYAKGLEIEHMDIVVGYNLLGTMPT